MAYTQAEVNSMSNGKRKSLYNNDKITFVQWISAYVKDLDLPALLRNKNRYDIFAIRDSAKIKNGGAIDKFMIAREDALRVINQEIAGRAA